MKRPGRVPDSPFWVEPGDIDPAGGRLHLSPEESHHLLRVFRASAGTPFEAIDGSGLLYRCVLEETERGIAVGRVESKVEESGELPLELGLLVGLPDMAQVESILTHAIPLGATSIDFFGAERSSQGALSAQKLDRMERLSRSALKQSRRSRLPALRSSTGLGAALEGILEGGEKYLADPGGEEGLGLPGDLKETWQPHGIIAIGPPGGFLEVELEQLRSRGFRAISLGPSRLSTSTATFALLTVVRNLLLIHRLPRVDKTGLSGYL